MNSEDCRDLTKTSLINEMNLLVNNYMQIYDEYYSTGSRDSAFLKDLVDSIKGISACLEVYTRDNYIHPGYAIQKLNYSLGMINQVKDFYQGKLENELDDSLIEE